VRAVSDPDDRDGPALAPRAWVVWSIAAVTIALVSNNPVYRVLVSLAALNVLLAWLPPGRNRKPLAIALTAAAILAALINVLASLARVRAAFAGP
jgi:hypothetical protein